MYGNSLKKCSNITLRQFSSNVPVNYRCKRVELFVSFSFSSDSVFIFPLQPLKFELAGGYWPKGPVKWFRFSECFELSSDFNERVLVKVQGECKKLFELLEVRVIGGSSYRDYTVLQLKVE